MRGALLVALALLACGEAPEPRIYGAPAKARAALVLEPPVLAVGQLADLELAVVTRPGDAVRPIDLPGKIAGFWLVERQAQAIAREPARWVHSTHLRLRAVEVGRFEFPGGSVEVTSPEGGAILLDYDSLPLEVVSTLPAHPTQQSPYGVRTLPLSRTSGRGSVAAFAAGAILALASAGVLLLARRRLAQRALAPPSEPMAPAWVAARESLAQAREALASDPCAALDLAAAALRGYAVRRFGGDATVRTTEELAQADPPFTMTTRWSGFVALLGELDVERFPEARVAEARASELVEAAAGFVEESVPKEARELDAQESRG